MWDEKKFFDFAHLGYLPTISAIQQKIFFRPFLFLFVNWAGQISADQTGPKKSKIKSYKLLFFYYIADVANCATN